MINLQKGERFDLSKDGKTLNNLRLGLGWDPAGSNSITETAKGFFSSMFGGNKQSSVSTNEQDIDIDASVFMLDSKRKPASTVYYGSLKSQCGSIQHCGDNLTGEGEGDDETILVNLDLVPRSCDALMFVVNIYSCTSRKQHFGMIQNAYIKIYDDKTGEVLAQYNLSDDYNGKTSIYVGEVYRRDNSWRFKALGDGGTDTSISEMRNRLHTL